ncbi:hypothetical protein [Vibrio sp. NH-UV-68]|uniref:hypothetical protein n=1 Tax=unclassified Vibrio TaxID=2614977 RepID=UPI0036F42FAA
MIRLLLKQVQTCMHQTSEIIVPTMSESEPERAPRLIKAYKHERTHQEVTEVELNRSKIVMIDENGNIKKVAIISEH